ncbi:hypothetical protein DSECCO2_268880 [anaerobic digester metagenome]
MTIFWQELKFQRRSLLIWITTFAAVLLLFMGIFPGFAQEADTLKRALAAFPKAMFDSIGMDIEKIFEASGFVSYIYGFIQLFLAIMGALYGLNIVNREKIARMNDFLYVKPVSRLSVFSQKVLAALVSFFLMNAVLYLMFHGMAAIWEIDQANLNTIDQIILGGLLLQLLVFSLASLLGLMLRRIKNPVGLATALSFTLFFILLIGRLMDDDKIKALTPFGYVEPLEITTKGLAGTTVAGFVALTAALLCLNAILLIRRDLEG